MSDFIFMIADIRTSKVALQSLIYEISTDCSYPMQDSWHQL